MRLFFNLQLSLIVEPFQVKTILVTKSKQEMCNVDGLASSFSKVFKRSETKLRVEEITKIT